MDAVLAHVAKNHPGALASILRRPHAAVFVRALRDAPPREGEALVRSLLATLALDLAHLRTLPHAVTLRRPPPRVVSLVARVEAHFADGPAAFDNGRPPFADVRHPFHAIDDGVVLALADDNPLAMLEAHPNKSGNAIDLGGESVEAWTSSLRAALSIVGEHLPALREEMTPFVQQIVPVGFFEDRHLSASYREAIGTLYMSLHPNAMTMAEALVHEYQHNKLNALFEVDDVLENDPAERYASPVRPDARPLAGVLLAVHALVPVAVLYERMIEAGDARARASRLREIVRGNREGTRVLTASARPTSVGRDLIDELVRYDRLFAKVLA